MKFCRPLTSKKGVALFIVLTSMATLAIFLGEITYTSQINQKLAYDRLDQVKATALAKSGFRLALLRIRAYMELRKMVKEIAGSGGVAAGAVNSVVPKEMLEKIWNEPITIPFSGDISSLPSSARDAVTKFRKDSNMEGKLYLSILSQSAKFNLNSYLPTFAVKPMPSPSPGTPGAGVAPNPSPASSPVEFDPELARQMLTEQITQTFQNRFDEDEKFRDQYRNLKISDIADDIMAWNDLSYSSMRAESAGIPYKKAPFYDISELHYLPTIDDEIYDLLAPSYSTTVESSINVNKILEPALTALVPKMTADERKKFFEFRDQTGKKEETVPGQGEAPPEQGGPFKEAKDFFDYLSRKVAAYSSPTVLQEFKDGLTKRGISIVVEESQFLVHIEATVQQTKKTLEAVVTLVPDPITPAPSLFNANAAPMTESKKRSKLKVVQMRFL